MNPAQFSLKYPENYHEPSSQAHHPSPMEYTNLLLEAVKSEDGLKKLEKSGPIKYREIPAFSKPRHNCLFFFGRDFSYEQ